MPITILECAIAAGAQADEHGSFSGEEINRVGFHFIGGCVNCHATIAAYNACPSQGGFWCCKDCIGNHGFETYDQFTTWQQEQADRDAKFDEFVNGVHSATEENA